jgi:hypothetical protein
MCQNLDLTMLQSPWRLCHVNHIDANLYHDMLTGRAVTGILHLLNGTPIDWCSNCQGTVDVAVHGSEFVAARIATDQIIDIRTTLRYLGIPIRVKTYMFGDKQSVVTCSTLPHSLLNKRQNALSCHRVQEAIAAKILGFIHIRSESNPADVLSKHCGFPQMWPHVKPFLVWRGDTNEIPNGVKNKHKDSVNVLSHPKSDGGECQETSVRDCSTGVTRIITGSTCHQCWLNGCNA